METRIDSTTVDHFFEEKNREHSHIEGLTATQEFGAFLEGGTSFKSIPTTLARRYADLLWENPHLLPDLVKSLEHTSLKVIYRRSTDIILVSDIAETCLCPISPKARKDAPSFTNSKEMLECLLEHDCVAPLAMESVGVWWAVPVMEMIQLHLDNFKDISARLRNALIQSLLHLNQRYNVLPQSIYLEDVSREGSYQISCGAFADIWKGRLNKEQDVCLKVLRIFTASYNKAKLFKELSKEVLIWRQLRHPHILEFLGITEEPFNDTFCIVSPWMQNGTIMSYSKAKGCSLQHKIDMLSTVALAMQYLHEYCPPVIHADIKGANVLVSENGTCYLADFGLAVFEDRTEDKLCGSTGQAIVTGSVPWLAPELINPDNFGAPSRTTRDIYAFGCTIFELVTGSTPFSEKRSEMPIMINVLHGARPKRPADMYPDWLWELAEACWAEEVSARPTARQVVRQLSGDESQDIGVSNDSGFQPCSGYSAHEDAQSNSSQDSYNGALYHGFSYDPTQEPQVYLADAHLDGYSLIQSSNTGSSTSSSSSNDSSVLAYSHPTQQQPTRNNVDSSLLSDAAPTSGRKRTQAHDHVGESAEDGDDEFRPPTVESGRDDSSGQPAHVQKRPPGACIRCRGLKMKCTFEADNGPCKRCLYGSHKCVVVEGPLKERRAHPAHVQERPRNACTYCKKLKFQCTFEADSSTCKRCLNGGQECVVEGRKPRCSPRKRACHSAEKSGSSASDPLGAYSQLSLRPSLDEEDVAQRRSSSKERKLSVSMYPFLDNDGSPMWKNTDLQRAWREYRARRGL